MQQSTRPLREYAAVYEAEIVRDRLAAADIRAFVTGTDMESALSMGGAGTDRLVRVEVHPDDYDLANETLLNDARRTLEAGDWKCSRCGEPNDAAFELCWSCNKPRRDDDVRIRSEDVVEEPPIPVANGFDDHFDPPAPASTREDGNPYRPVLVTPEKPVGLENSQASPAAVSSDDLDEQVRRVLIAAFAAVFLFPPISTLYVMSLLWRLPPEAHQHPNRRKRIYTAWGVTAFGSMVGIGYVLVILTQ
ncbi:hypothetical protein K227x_20230 [Rubripirellula lacrimiformis]|uniref:RanBP2-type domain-containing protein n=1 Tax=Rubripirellula lacrimiformis TaxID=1930273 RepID=A0A517N929_9BACT|nr:hypothetical protein [Rubripirellula lacrimiformis]QDT03639.1 hypothetical protein K227x_20230 [Rubripirellula lacrimiformis]